MISDVDEESKTEIEKLFKSRINIYDTKKMKEIQTLFNSMGTFDDGTLSDFQWFAKFGN